jgi:methylated-DNA-[protein]-cysteine S-methyltransferase
MSTPSEYDVIQDSPLGRLGIRFKGDAVCAIDFLEDDAQLRPSRSKAAKRVTAALQRYFTSPERPFELDVMLAGTPFQQRVWRALQAIPAGQTRSYGQLATELGTGARAVGNACRNNPVSIVVPCHRVVGASGPGGFSGQRAGTALQRKLWLLAHEGSRPGA